MQSKNSKKIATNNDPEISALKQKLKEFKIEMNNLRNKQIEILKKINKKLDDQAIQKIRNSMK